MRRWVFSILILLALAAAAFFTLAPGLIERDLNKIDGKPLPQVSARAQALHRTLTIVDLHSDSLLWKRSILDRADRGHMDLPRLEDGNVALQILASTTKSPKGQNYDANGADTDNITSLVIAQLQPVRTWNSLLERSLWHAEKLHRAVAASDGKLTGVTRPEEIDVLLLERSAAKPALDRTPAPVGALLSLEGLHPLEGKLANLDKLYAAGFRMAGLTHFFDNDLAGSMHGLKKGGLTPTGRQVVEAMEAKGMIVDIAHCSSACVADILKMARRPVVSSHGGVQATCKVNRNLSDEQIRGVAATGGLIGIGYWDAAVCDTSPASIAKAMTHVRDLVGIEHVALGSDYDGATTVRFDTSKLVQVTQALIDAGFSDDEIRAAMGGNAIRVLKAGLVPLTPPTP
ncbi:dipeptidase [Sphingopyxis sp. RIFCSPHIGHO2_12_FULL_65_19]|uniref:dipeptidase n=1 Tax=Sphingopyxis sp. RIFCSPHIGHO2_12_FULL_65_19 TaxID=1802172 RepID=UPI0008D78A37|nr:dipeptidase [Sphingopyxis sp. RIFCSPHIGHO2_12_FULL_65_19]OHD06364.1 MAG: peptidase M19 [Sphingopyxis sp. RIFCSPHIGHO2_12_FULL_65_19]